MGVGFSFINNVCVRVCIFVTLFKTLLDVNSLIRFLFFIKSSAFNEALPFLAFHCCMNHYNVTHSVHIATLIAFYAFV